jgi:7,8-dihydropterin-6-yl-methyl-4-(beta-D-ribofuranosyl)aminobenzene 5'-phosphate synthase
MKEDQMRITCVVDNQAKHSSDLWGEHGLAALVEVEEGSVLLDTGKSGDVLLHNMALLGIDAAEIDALAISHNHADHTGGLAALAPRLRKDVTLYAHPDLFRARFSIAGRTPDQISADLSADKLRADVRLALCTEPQEVLPGVWTTGEITSRPHPEGRSEKHQIRTEEGWKADPYRDDLSLVLQAAGGLFLLCGCCHAGLLNTIAHVEDRFGADVIGIAGGTHLLRASDERVEAVAKRLAERGVVRGVYPGHCSGNRTYAVLRNALGPEAVHPWMAGVRVTVDEPAN